MGFNLSDFSIFQDLKADYINLVEPLFEPFSCAAGDVILQQGKSADYLYLIIRGSAEVSYKPYDGDPITVAHVERGGLFGWSAVVGRENYTSSVIAVEPLEAMRVHGSALRKFCQEHPGVGKNLLDRLANSVSSRWEDAKEQVKSILLEGIKRP
jgi:CRP-like cAMP-binding protein